MDNALSKRERLRRVVAGEPVDRLPLSLWRHFYAEETSVDPLVQRHVAWHQRFNFDFVKINTRAQYHTEGWGSRYVYSGQEHVKPLLATSALEGPRDFATLRQLDPWAWPLGEMIQVIQGLRRALGADEVLLMTVFNPLSVALDLAGGPEKLLAALRQEPRAVHRGLRAITDTFRDFAGRCLEQGADGLYFATTHTASAANFTIEQYEEFGRPYDLEVLDVVGDAFLNVLHVCGSRAYVRELADYPVKVLHWDTTDPENVPLKGMLWATDKKALACGLAGELFARRGGASTILNELAAARQALGTRPFIVTGSCTIPTTSLEENINALCRAVRS